jgi:hypothetical protein
MVSEAKLIEAMKEEADRLRIPADRLQLVEASVSALAALEAKRDRVRDLFIDGMLDKDERNRRWTAIDVEADQLRAFERLVDIPPSVDWDWEAAQINAVLRALRERVELGPDLMPVRFVWRVPEWRAA